MEKKKVIEDQIKEAKFNIWVFLLFLTFVLGTGGFSYLYYLEIEKNKAADTAVIERNITISEKNKEIERRKTAVDETRSILVKTKHELTKVKSRLEGITNPNDLMVRDIFIYIDKNYQIVPRTVALEIANQIVTLSKKHNISTELVVGITEIESNFNPLAISKVNARGLMQVMPEWAKKFGLKKVSDLHDINTGIESGIKVLKIHIQEQKGSIKKGLYYYVGKDSKYSSKVYGAMGRFVAFRSIIDDDEAANEIAELTKKEETKNPIIAGTEKHD